MYIHLMEMSPHPERALMAADRLCTASVDAGHLVHMPTHIYLLLGKYHEVVVGACRRWCALSWVSVYARVWVRRDTARRSTSCTW
jgi:hypothetical protein